MISTLLMGYWLVILKVIDIRGENDLISNMMIPGCIKFLHSGQDVWRTVTGLGH